MAAPTSIKDTRVKRFSPVGASDSLDATDEFPGACVSLANLIPELTTRNVWACRPAATQIFQFQNSPNLPGGHNAGVCSIYKVVGSIVYGLFVDTTAVVDTPFAYNLATSTWITVGGTGTKPTRFGHATGQVIYPTIDLMGKFLIVTHPSFVSPAFIGWFDLTTPATPTWNTGDLTAGGAITFTSLGSKPDWVRQFNQRAYFGVNGITQPSVVATDVLTLKITNASQALTFGDNLPLTAAAPLGLANQLGGIIQSLMVFKGVSNIHQITGDFATTNIAINTLNVATGTQYIRSICSTPLGLAFMSPDGLRIIDPNAAISDPIGIAGKGISAIFLQILGISPYCSIGCDGDVLRIFFVNDINSYEFWYDIPRKVWSGPHSNKNYAFDVYNADFVCDSFNLFLAPTGLCYSPTDITSTSTFTEAGSPLTFTMQSAVLEDNAQMAGSELTEMQVVASAVSNNTMTVTLLDPNGATINSSSIVVNSTGLWPYRVDFPAQSVFNRAAISITGASAAGVRIGDSWLRLKTLAYILPPPNPPSS